MVDSSASPWREPSGAPVPVTVPVDLAPGVSVAYTTRLGGVSQGDYASLNLGGKGDDPAAVTSNREALGRALGAQLVLVSQVHSGRAVDADALLADQLKDVEADGLVSAQTGLALGVFAADCLPVLLADPEAGVIGAAHCGRKGLERGIIGATVDLMEAKGARRGSISATLGPAICGDCYELGEGISDAFGRRFPGATTSTSFGGPGVDISAAALQDLQTAGVTRVVDSLPRIAAASRYLREDQELADLCADDGQGPALTQRMADLRHPRCTLENPLWYSHRRSSLAERQGEGRMLALVTRQG
ncbi:copper oxidase [Bifidobacterium actinocoloniiforme DSM 22766]|nr:copper oxidase [Bifidobacterium actinocoloniiforme DSM 22766]